MCDVVLGLWALVCGVGGLDYVVLILCFGFCMVDVGSWDLDFGLWTWTWTWTLDFGLCTWTWTCTWTLDLDLDFGLRTLN